MRTKVLWYLAIVVTTAPAHAGLDKWFKNEVVPTVTGERPLDIKPYVSISHDGHSIKVGPKEAHLKIGGIKIQTSNLTQRLLQAGCVMEAGTTGAMICGQNVIASYFGQPGVDRGAIGGQIPPSPPSQGRVCVHERGDCVTPDLRSIGSNCYCFVGSDGIAGTIQR